MPAPILTFYLDEKINLCCNYLNYQASHYPQEFGSVLTVTTADVHPDKYHELTIGIFYLDFLHTLILTDEAAPQQVFTSKPVILQAELLDWSIKVMKDEPLSLSQGIVSAAQQPFSEFSVIHSFIVEPQEHFWFCSVHFLGLAALYKFIPGRFDVAEAVRSGTVKMNSPDFHLWMILRWRSKMRSLRDLTRKDRSLVNVKALLEDSLPC